MKYSEALTVLEDRANHLSEAIQEAAEVVAERIQSISDHDVSEDMIAWLMVVDLPRIEREAPVWTPPPLLLAGLWEQYIRGKRQ